MPTPEDFEKARQYLADVLHRLETDGWCQNQVIAKNGSCCLSHAMFNSMILCVKYTNYQRQLAQNSVARYLHKTAGVGIVQFNDYPLRKFSDIRNLLLTVSDELENLNA